MSQLELAGLVVVILTFVIQFLKGKITTDPDRLKLYSLGAGLVAGVIVAALKSEGAWADVLTIIGSILGPTIVHAGIKGNPIGDTLKAAGVAVPLVPNKG